MKHGVYYALQCAATTHTKLLTSYASYATWCTSPASEHWSSHPAPPPLPARYASGYPV